jgi:branched-subunit amino acid permease
VGLEVYYPQDIRNAILAAEQAASAAADAAGNRDDPFTAGFLAGYRAALTTLALSFGLVVQDSGNRRQPEPLAGLLAEPPASRCR